jgi:mannose-1-phosphate guanylyltransferase/mannose-6-phosphate isomerase
MVKHVVILAGGSGTRLWPASREAFPKQFLTLSRGKSLFLETLLRASSLGIEGSIIVVTHEDHTGEIVKQWNSLSSKEGSGLDGPGLRTDGLHGPERRIVLAEPIARNTAPAIAYAAAFLKNEGEGDSSFIVLASDHLITPVDQFKADVEKASQLAREKFLVTFGIPPRGPDTGFGYIEIDKEQPPGFRVKRFHEKPDHATAVSYVDLGNFFWNSGMFTFQVDVFLDELQRHAPDIGKPFGDVSTDTKEWESVRVPGNPMQIRSLYENLPSISIDYALMEKCHSAAMVKAGFEWSDIGSWDEVSRFFDSEKTETLEVEGSGSFVYSDIPVAIAGISDLIVVIRNGVALVCRKGSSQLVRNVVQKLKQKGRKELL